MTNHVPAAAAGGLSSETVRDIVERWSVNVGGRFVASPLYAEDVPFGNAREDAIFVATNAGTVAALRAVDGSVLWKRQVSAATLIPACNITYGISSTPVLDRSRGRLYAIGSDGLLHALSLATGEEIDGWPVRIVQLTGSEYVWSGLTLRGNRLYVPVASFCDKPDPDGYNADGRLVAVDVLDPRIVASLDITEGPNNMGGIWGYAGVTIDPDTGHLWTATGNGFVFDPECGGLSRRDGRLRRGGARAGRRSQRRRLEPARGRQHRRGQRLRRRAAALPAARLPAARRRQREERQDVHLEPRRLSPPGRSGAPASARASSAPRSSPSRATRRSWACSSSPPLATTTSRARSGRSTQSSASRSARAARFPSGRRGRRPASAAAPSHRRSIVGDLVFVPGGFDRNAFALNATTGEVLWTVGLPGASLAPISFAGDEVLIADSAGNLHAFGLERPIGIGKPGLYAM